MPAGEVRRAFHFRDDCRVRPDALRLRDAPDEAAADDAFDHYRLVDRDLPARVVDCKATTHSSPGRRSVYFSFSEDTYVAAMRARTRRRSDEDCAVEETQLRLIRMIRGTVCRNRSLYRHPFLDERT